MVQGISTVAARLNGYLPHFAQFNVPQRKHYYLGHTYQAISDKFKIFSELTSLTDSLHYLFQFAVGAATVVTQGTLFRGCAQLAEVIRHIDVVRTYGDVSYFVKGEFLEDLQNNFISGFISSSFFLSCSIGTCLDLANDFRLVNLPAIAKSIGNASIFGVAPLHFVSKLPVGEFCCLTATAGFLFGTIDNFMKIQAGDHSRSRLLQLAYCIASLTMQIFFIAGQSLLAAPAGTMVGGALTMISSGYGAWWIWQVEKEKA